jgi:hypothetical protein
MNQVVSFSRHEPFAALTPFCSNITRECVVKLLLLLLMGKPRKLGSWISYVSMFLKLPPALTPARFSARPEEGIATTETWTSV